MKYPTLLWATISEMSSQKVYDICLIGCGVSGTILLLKLLETISPEKICVVDPAFDGGDLMRRWSDINSNTTWQDFINATDNLPIAKPVIDKIRDKYNPDSVTPVWELSKSLNLVLKPYLKNMDANTCHAKSANFDSATGRWKIVLESPGCFGIKYAKTVLYAPGGNPKQVNLNKPQIPLEVALDSSRLARVLEAGQNVLLFGLSHSGVLVIRNLLKAGARVSAVYRTREPFTFASDGAYQGIKQEAATFAKELLANPNEYVNLIPSHDAESTIREFTNADVIISAIGFVKKTNTCVFSVDNNEINQAKYNTESGALINAPSAFGFGLAYPSTTTINEKVYEDAGVGSFVKHAIAITPGIISSST